VSASITLDDAKKVATPALRPLHLDGPSARWARPFLIPLLDDRHAGVAVERLAGASWTAMLQLSSSMAVTTP